MKSEWARCRLGDLVTFQRGYDLPKTKMKSGNYPVVGSNGIIGWHNEYTTENPSITIGRSGNVGNPFVVKSRSWSHNTTLYIKEFKHVDPLFIYYFLKILNLANFAGGSAVPTLNRNHIHSLPVFVPVSIEEQQKIASILSALDNKIELNQKINENLEQQMQALYQKLLAENDCTLARLEELASKIAMGPFGANIKVSTFVPSGVPIISGNHLRSFFLEEPSYNYITEEHAQRLKNSIVFPKDIIFTHAGNIGQVAMIPEGCDYPYYIISQRQFYMRCDESKVIPEIFLFFFHSIEGKGKLLANANSTGVPSIAQPSTHLKNIEMPLPAKEAQDKWYNVIRPMVRCYISLCQENKRLSKIRDFLLPRLMSGKIDVFNISV